MSNSFLDRIKRQKEIHKALTADKEESTPDVTVIHGLCYMVAKQRHEANECDAFCSFCYTEAEDYLANQRLKELENNCMRRFFSNCDCPLCERSDHAEESTES